MVNFKVGDRVKTISRVSNEEIKVGTKGTVKVGGNSGSIGVEFDKEFKGGHDLNRNGKDGFGWYVDSSDIEKIIGEKKEKKVEKKKFDKYVPGESIEKYVEKLIKVETNKDKLKWLNSYNNCVLPENVKEMIEEAVTIVLRADIFDKWGLNEHFEKGIANTILIYGDPGTGKTMICESLAGVLDKNLMKLDTGSLQSNIPGQTERNIKESFALAKKNDCVLLIDECDSILYDRNMVGAVISAEINTLLTEIERFEGIVILTTNRLQRLDSALQRRILAKVELPLPNKKARIRIWRNLIPKKMPVENLDYDELSNADLSGGEIKNAIILSARNAIAKNENKVTMRHFLSSITKILQEKNHFLSLKPKGREHILSDVIDDFTRGTA